MPYRRRFTRSKSSRRETPRPRAVSLPQGAAARIAARAGVRSMKTMLIVYHSMTGGTLQMAQAAAAGAPRRARMQRLDAAGLGGERLGRARGRRLCVRFAGKSRRHVRPDEGFLRPHLLCGVGPAEWQALRGADLRRQRRPQCGGADTAHRDRVALARDRRSLDRVYACADTRGNLAREANTGARICDAAKSLAPHWRRGLRWVFFDAAGSGDG